MLQISTCKTHGSTARSIAACRRAVVCTEGSAAKTIIHALHASAADIEALSARLGDAAVLESMFLVDGAPRQFLRREQFVSGLVEAAGPALSEDAAYECWLAFGGSPRPATKKKEDKGFFGNFVAQIAENAGGVKDTREKDQWGNPISGMTVIDQAVITSEQKAVLASMASKRAGDGGGEDHHIMAAMPRPVRTAMLRRRVDGVARRQPSTRRGRGTRSTRRARRAKGLHGQGTPGRRPPSARPGER